MEKFKGTKGPWKIGNYSGCVVSDNMESITISGATGKENTDYYGGNLICESVSNENAKLIAAAPDLLEALNEVILISYRNHNAWHRAKLAIKKATE